jgi:hypothetical protein
VSAIGAGWSVKTRILSVHVETGLLLIIWRAARDPCDPGTLTCLRCEQHINKRFKIQIVPTHTIYR